MAEDYVEKKDFPSRFRSFLERLRTVPLHIRLFIIALSVAIISVGLCLFISPEFLRNILKKQKPSTPEAENIWEPAKSTPRPLAHGKQTYAISGSKKGAPKATEVAIDPLDPAQGASQSATVKVLAMEAGPVTKVSVDLITDNKTKTYPLQLISGTNLDGVWNGTWVMEDSYDYKYQMAIKAENSRDSWTVTLTFR